MSKIGLYVKFTARPGQRDALAGQLLRAAEGAGAAPGCEIYIVSTSPTEADAVWVTEVWSSQEDHDASLAIAGAKDLIQQTLPLLARPPEQIHTTPLGGKGLARA